MGEDPNKFPLSRTQRITLFISTIILSLILFFVGGDLTSNSPLDAMARKSLDPQEALNNQKPTIYEFYADWCDSCKRMAPDLLRLAEERAGDIDVVLLNVDNPLWQDLIDKYHVKGIPNLVFFNQSAEYQGNILGVKSFEELQVIFNSLTSFEEKNNLNEILQANNGDMISRIDENTKNYTFANPRSHG